MTTKEEELKKLENEVKEGLFEVSKSLIGNDYSELNKELDNRVSMLNESFINEVKSFSVTAVTAAPFSLTLLMSGLDIDKTFLILSFIFLMIDVLFLNIGVWYINTRFANSTASQKLEAMIMDTNKFQVVDEKKENNERLDALYELFQSESRLKYKKSLEPYKQQKLLKIIRDLGILVFSVSIIFLILSILAQNVVEVF